MVTRTQYLVGLLMKHWIQAEEYKQPVLENQIKQKWADCFCLSLLAHCRGLLSLQTMG